ncbi:GtrA family protein [Gracilibacillus kekensis]|uniref:Putative flippase GtrA (Transmembrane translocase of bactoprenol-linked glucose) n=1 Tax=Gracilibacillus kekensis TaxID=1027249 RepID=A0A1M7QBZ8_9BACI|nr:GtrA family protein [Gracilibacillus kekensis]SHN28231.1 Putative flippase GtrA (transmembrane translocase of bactoprenol-linked glucose) [Gracilibacillus kekensis]
MKKHPKKSGRFQFFQFSMIGASNAIIDIGALNILLLLFHTENRVILLVFNTIAYSLAILNSYIWNASITFKRTSEGNAYQRFSFIVQAIVSLVISNGVFIGAHTLFMAMDMPSWWNYNLAKLLAMVLSSLASFFMVKFFVFRDY